MGNDSYDKQESSQSYFWTEEWQAKEKRADEDLKQGRFKRYASAEEAIADLNKTGDEDIDG